jgi:hypothetical protein
MSPVYRDENGKWWYVWTDSKDVGPFNTAAEAWKAYDDRCGDRGRP